MKINEIEKNINNKSTLIRSLFIYKNLIRNNINIIQLFNINCFNILLIGRKGVGKTTVTAYILDTSNNNANIKKIIINNDFIEYTSEKVK